MNSNTIILNTDDYITELFEKGIIDEETYLENIENLVDTEVEEDFIDEYQYIYKVVIDKKTKLYYSNPNDTHHFMEFPNAKVYYIRVPTNSPEHQSAFYNSKANNRITIDDKTKVKTKDKIQFKIYEKSIDV